jgi:hypothetical protein
MCFESQAGKYGSELAVFLDQAVREEGLAIGHLEENLWGQRTLADNPLQAELRLMVEGYQETVDSTGANPALHRPRHWYGSGLEI